ncbi:copper resistance protein NlpE N-terminal domain-containing protein [Parafilimonas sp.]|uniref:copper resistance protein NlpE N-terminal domain-containing protein n=1 Tax=Parafilimonas sp. TaxID=1969739 RepID=UPI003F7D9559
MKNALIAVIIIICAACLYGCKSSSKATQNNNIPATGDNSMNALDWDGIYRGVLPCADCPGIETIIYLNRDLTYHIKTRYLSKPDNLQEDSGKFVWNNAGNTITLQGLSGRPSNYFVGENTLTQLDMGGNKITGVLADKYILSKQQYAILEKYWKLVELNGKPVMVNNAMSKEPHIIFKMDSSRVIGNGGCNNFFGTYTLEGANKITIKQVGSTLMACPNNMQTESEFLKALQAADNYYINGDELILNKTRMAQLAKFKTVYMQWD